MSNETATRTITITLNREDALHVAHTLEYQSGGSDAWNMKSETIAPLFRKALVDESAVFIGVKPEAHS